MIDKSFIGRELPPSTLTLERGRLRFFAQAIGETDPVYTDVDAARAAGYADLPAPPTFLFAAELDSGQSTALLELLQIPLAKLLHGEQGFTLPPRRPAPATPSPCGRASPTSTTRRAARWSSWSRPPRRATSATSWWPNCAP